MIHCHVPVTIVRSHEARAQSSGIWGAPTTILALAGTWGTAMIKHQAPTFMDRTQTFPEENYPVHLALAEALAVPGCLSKVWRQESNAAIPCLLTPTTTCIVTVPSGCGVLGAGRRAEACPTPTGGTGCWVPGALPSVAQLHTSPSLTPAPCTPPC